MKKTQIKDAVRNIRAQIISFLSIIIVVSLGVSIFLVCRMGALSSSKAGTEFYEQTNYHDLEIRSSRGITEDDVAAVRAFDGVIDAEGLIAVDMLAYGNGKTTVHVVSATERLDRVILLDGTLPSRAGECAITEYTASELSIKIGDKLTLKQKDDSVKYLKNDTFTVTAIISHPDKFGYKVSTTSNVLLTRDSFDVDGLGVPYTGIVLTLEADDDKFSEKYKEQIAEYLHGINVLGKERAALRDNDIRTEAQSLIAENEAKLKDARTKLDEAHIIASSGETTASDAEVQLMLAQLQLDISGTQLESLKAELDSGKEKLERSAIELGNVKAQIDDGKKQLEEGRAELEKAETQIRDGEKQLKDAEKQLNSAWEELHGAKETLSVLETLVYESARAVDETEDYFVSIFTQVIPDLNILPGSIFVPLSVLSDNYVLNAIDVVTNAAEEYGLSVDQITELVSDIDLSPRWSAFEALYDVIRNAKSELDQGWYQYYVGYAQWEKGRDEYETALEEFNAGKEKYEAGYLQFCIKESELNTAQTLYNANLATYESGLAEYEAGLAKYADAKKQIEDGQAELDKKKEEFTSGKSELDDGRNELILRESDYEEGLAALNRAKEELAALEDGNWILMSRFVNFSYCNLYGSMQMYYKLGASFAILFVFLSVLVCYATMGKIIDDQKKLVGTTKALGFKRSEILSKYMIFGVGSAVCGAVAGILLAFFVLQKIMLDKLSEIYLLGEFKYIIEPIPSLLSAVLSAAVCALATYAVCSRLLKKPAVKLINGEPASTKNKEKYYDDGKKRRSLYAGLILRNIRSDLKRVAITIASIAGCCVLLIIGFSIKMSYEDIIVKQFDEIINYRMSVSFLPDKDGAQETIRKIVSENTDDSMPVYQLDTLIRIGNYYEGVQLCCADPDKLMEYYTLYDLTKRSVNRIPDGGVVIFSRLAETYNLSVGDHISVLDGTGKFRDVTISGIFNNYAGKNAFMSLEFAKSLFGDSCRVNSYAVKLGESGEETLLAALEGEESFDGISDSADLRERVVQISDSASIVIVVMIVMAGIMAAVVLLNLVRMQINQKKRELTIMRINGFTMKETVNYILRENILTTFAGIAVGLVVGCIAARFNLSALERIDMQMIRQISIPSCVFSVLITLFFAAVVNFIALRSVKKLKLNKVD